VLFDAIATPMKQFVSIRGGDHNDASPSEPVKYWRTVEEFIDIHGRRTCGSS